MMRSIHAVRGLFVTPVSCRSSQPEGVRHWTCMPGLNDAGKEERKCLNSPTVNQEKNLSPSHTRTHTDVTSCVHKKKC